MLIAWKKKQELMFNSWREEQDATLSLLVRDIAELRSQCLQIQKENNELQQSMNFMNSTFEDALKIINLMEKEKVETAEKIRSLEQQILDVQLQYRPTLIEIRNVPVINKEKESTPELLSMLSQLGSAVDQCVQSGDVRDIYRRLGGANPSNSPRPIVVDFNTPLMRNRLLGAVRRYNKDRPFTEKLHTHMINLPGDKRPMFLDKWLPHSLRKLFHDARLIAKEHGFTCWHYNGRIFLRKGKEDNPIRVTFQQVLQDLIKKK